MPRSINFKRKKFSKAFCGGYHTFILSSNHHDLFGLGLNNYGQLGNPNYLGENQELPLEIDLPFNDNVQQIAAGEHHTLLLTSNGQIYSFGRGDSGQLGHGNNDNLFNPTEIQSLSNLSITFISCGSAFSLALSNEPCDNLYMWGYGEMGQLANGLDEDSNIPSKINLKGRTVLNASCGGQHTVLLLSPKPLT
jgi:regulator of chromosome condensation